MTNKVKIQLPISGMACASCVAKAEKTLNQIEGVNAKVNLAAAKAEVEVPEGFAAQQLKTALEKLNYATSVDRFELSIIGMSCASCVAKVEKALQSLPGVLEARVNLANEKAYVEALAGNLSVVDLIRQVKASGYQAQASSSNLADEKARKQKELKQLKKDLWLSAILTIPVVVLGMGEHLGLGHEIAHRLGHFYSGLIQFIFTSAVLFGPGWRFIKVGMPALWRKSPDMNSLVALGSGAAWFFSTLVVFASAMLPEQARHYYFEAAAVIVTLILFGRLLEARAKGKTGEAVQKLLSLQEKTARKLVGDETVETAIEALQVGDQIIVRPGERIALDGVVVAGSSLVDESMLTGEPLAVAKKPQDKVTGGTLNNSGALTVRITHVGKETRLAQIIALVEQAQAAKLSIQTVLDQVTGVFVPMVMLAAFLTFVIWFILGGEQALSMALINAVAVLIIACPCAMGLATPTSIMVGTGRAAEMGVLFHKGDALQTLNQCQIVAFDKTGTLTEGKPTLTDIIALSDRSEKELLTLAASAEQGSEHSLATALLQAAAAQNIALLPLEDFIAEAGKGVQAKINGQWLALGGDALLKELGGANENITAQAQALAEQGKTRLFLFIDRKPVAIFAIMDKLRDSAEKTLAKLHERGIKTALISGDNEQTARAIARTLKMDLVFGGVLPEGKVEKINELRQQFGTLAFVGDGINDAPALAKADIGIAMGSGTDIAMEAADVVLMNTQLTAVIKALDVSAATLRNIKQNLFWAFAYNIVLIPVAAGALYPLWGVLLSPMLASAAMALSSVFVVSNALRLKKLK